MIDLTSQTFDSEVSQNEIPVVVLWRTEGSVLSNTTAFALAEAVKNFKTQPKLAQVNIDDHADLAMRFSIRHIPFLILFVNGMSMASAPDLNHFLAASHQWLN